MSQSDFVPLNKWKARYRCPEHGSVSTKHCLICDAEHALEQRLHRERLRVSVDPETVAEILRDAGIDPIEPQAEPLASDDAASEQSDQAASESVTGDASGVVDDGGRPESLGSRSTIPVSLAHNPSSKSGFRGPK